jgi:hypothetical protein
MQPSHRSSRRRPQARPSSEVLETRSLLTGGAGNTFAMLPGTVTNSGGTAVIPFTLSPAQFTMPKGKMVLGIDVVPRQNSNIQPLISQVTNPHKDLVPQAIHAIYNPHLSHAAVARGAGTRAVLAPVSFLPGSPTKPATYSVTVSAQSKTNGNFLLGFYLPGDVNGDGVVDQTDINLIKAAMGTKTGNTKYNFDADANRDGRIGPTDLAYAKQNFGVKILVTPTVTANLDPATINGATGTRTTSIQNVRFTGTDTPGAAITFAEINKKAPTVKTTVKPDGTYALIEPLGAGMNTFNVTSVDDFGQSISGNISPVTYTPDPAHPTANAGLPLPNLATATTTAATTTTSTSTSTPTTPNGTG